MRKAKVLPATVEASEAEVEFLAAAEKAAAVEAAANKAAAEKAAPEKAAVSEMGVEKVVATATTYDPKLVQQRMKEMEAAKAAEAKRKQREELEYTREAMRRSKEAQRLKKLAEEEEAEKKRVEEVGAVHRKMLVSSAAVRPFGVDVDMKSACIMTTPRDLTGSVTQVTTQVLSGTQKGLSPSPSRKRSWIPRRTEPLELDGRTVHRVLIPCSALGRQLSCEVEVTISGRTDAQHMVTWAEPVGLPVQVNGVPATLQPGYCNLYRYPRVYFDHLRKDKAVVPSGSSLFVLEKLLLALLLNESNLPDGRCYSHRLDASGARPHHGLLVSNTPSSLALVLEAFEARPGLIALRHIGPPFEGENALHILAVNKREDELCRVIKLAASTLETEVLRETFRAVTSGVFFSNDPMDFYGSSPLSYFVAFSLQRALTTLLLASKSEPRMAGLVDLNDPEHACPLTGFLPLHVAVANSLTGMFNFLIDLPGLPITFDKECASPFGLSQHGHRHQWAALTPLGLGVKLGEKRIVKYILRTQSTCEWAWGPVSSWYIDMRGIDSIGSGSNDVLELLGKLDALPETQEMLLDSFVDGIFHKLLTQKFKRFGRAVFVLMRMLDLAYLLCLCATAMLVKTYPRVVLYDADDADAGGTDGGEGFMLVAHYLPYATLACIVPMLEEDVRSAVGWWSAERATAKQAAASFRARSWSDILLLLRWCSSNQMLTRLLGWLCALCVMMQLIYFRAASKRDPYEPWWDAASLDQPAEQLTSLLVPLALGIMLHAKAFFRALVTPWEKLGVLYNVCFKMLSKDVGHWLLLFAIFILNYGFVVYVCYPPNFSDPVLATADPVPGFNDFGTAVWSLIETGLIGERIQLDISSWKGFNTSSAKAVWTNVAFVAFLMSVITYYIMALVLLLNLLIAMMGETYKVTMQRATLEWRVAYARQVLRLEIQIYILQRWGWLNLNCGERQVDSQSGTMKWVFKYPMIERNAEGGGMRGKNRTSMFDASVESEAELHELDDDGPGGGDAATITTKGLSVAEGATPRVPPVHEGATSRVPPAPPFGAGAGAGAGRHTSGGDLDLDLEDLEVDTLVASPPPHLRQR
jgi:hypothetical protein